MSVGFIGIGRGDSLLGMWLFMFVYMGRSQWAYVGVGLCSELYRK